jgi:putative ABC transport system permease protein
MGNSVYEDNPMKAQISIRFEMRMAWRETRPALKRFVFLVSIIALGVGSLTGIKGFSHALQRAMSRSARELIAADLSVSMTGPLGRKDLDVLQTLSGRGASLTRVTETLSMASSDTSPAPVLCSVKAVDPQQYPYYGNVELEPAGRLRDVLRDGTVVATQELLVRTGTSVGSSVTIGSEKFRVAAVLRTEPDRLASGFDWGPRILMTRAGLEKAGLIRFGSRATESFLYRLPPGLPVEEARRVLKGGLERTARISDYHTPNQSVSRALERMTEFLSLIGMLSLLVGGLGVATTIHSYLQQKLDSIAVMKCLGGNSKQIIRVYLIQGALLGLAGSVLGIVLGYIVQLVFPTVLRGLLDLPTELDAAPSAAIQGFLIGLATTLLFLLPPLLAIRNVRPTRIFLREMPETHYSTLQRLRRDPMPALASLVLLFGIGCLTSWAAGSWKRGWYFSAGLVAAILVLAIAAKLLLAVVRRVPRPRLLALRHGLKNLGRPGAHVASVLVALGLGVGFVLTVYFVQTSLLPQIIQSAPADFPNLFLLGITERDRDPLWSFLSREPGVTDPGVPIPAVPARLRRIDGKTADQLALEHDERHFFQIEFILSWSERIPPDTKLVEGRWWDAAADMPQISVGLGATRHLPLHVGSILEFESSGRLVRGRVANVREAEFARPGSSNQFLFSPGSLDGLPTSYVGAVRVAPGATAALQRALFARFPNVTSIDPGHIIARVQGLLDKVANVIRFIAAFAILCGVIMLATSVASTRYQRVREAVLLKTLGATRAQVARIQAMEFLTIGLMAGFIGAMIASAAAHILLGTLLETEFRFQWATVLVGTLATAVLAIATGWIASRGVLRHRPLEILREN